MKVGEQTYVKKTLEPRLSFGVYDKAPQSQREGKHMLEQQKSAAQPHSLARRHFIAITALTARRVLAVSVVSSMAAGMNIRKAAADHDRHEHHHHEHGGDPSCFGRGTLILTPDGEVPVEDLSIGTLVTTTNGALPIKWLGRYTMRRNRSAAWHPSVVPVRVSRFAFDDQAPRRDLYLSPEHALFIDGGLIPVKYLVNGCSITVDDSVHSSETIEYFHIELDSHEAVYAEGMPAETFRYMGWKNWDNLKEYQALYGDPKAMPPFAPVHSYGGVRGELRGLVRLAASHFVDVRDPIQIAYSRLAARARLMAA